ncbi:hypothetical protein KSZ_07770 [Dictyobacter formicarum]|uniref:Reverse transcriptase N-terminal domain-containing protein n=1 Tax=Dictyobacter formicarum TaxID=2778368 RepID=A0ABQ3VC49_9CHLR|nr:hypothetical protein KSZ_07770 [Dictyobacter formicarum]
MLKQGKQSESAGNRIACASAKRVIEAKMEKLYILYKHLKDGRWKEGSEPSRWFASFLFY